MSTIELLGMAISKIKCAIVKSAEAGPEVAPFICWVWIPYRPYKQTNLLGETVKVNLCVMLYLPLGL